MRTTRCGTRSSGQETPRYPGAKCLVAWDECTQPQHQGGLGIRDLSVQNDCLLVKLIHRLHTATDSSWATWVCEQADIASMMGDMAGTHWSTLQRLRPAYQFIAIVTIGDDNTTSFWNDQWPEIGRLGGVYPTLASHAMTTSRSVAQVMATGLRAQLVPRLSLAALDELEEVSSLALYNLVMTATDLGYNFAKFVWRNRALSKVQFFGWLMVREREECTTNLLIKNIVADDTCEVCHSTPEDKITSSSIVPSSGTSRTHSASTQVKRRPPCHGS
ncbi:hypothetical protein PR202_ga25484 [Eleusine coracana subsp. coracana]|uniref:Reverse transcriptase zinc-binding domain-containing protein n=1 Tax=Eleusine coracana subsp. coracana TaxID=191504 RepID=A0AAV5DBB2_ELECO|nr:hypothetical protein PR202_ga25423 [Eleusine coracana subsp. coracana]GJN07639.1 hypothetical protein PR202_ga25484 [Eleusine coracana subsp. coracana]